MTDALDFAPGGYRFIPSVFQYSAGVAALPGHEIQRVRFRRRCRWRRGSSDRAADQGGRPSAHSFCACELRSPAPFTEQGFRAFNEIYVVTLEKWGLFDGKTNPVARSNVCPELDPPPQPSFHAFSFTVAAAHPPRSSFVIAGGAEAREGGASYRERTIRHGETSPDAIREKARYVLGEMERRLELLGFGVGRYHRHAGLYGARPPSVPGGRDRAARRGPIRADLALRPSAGARARIRDGLPRGQSGKRSLTHYRVIVWIDFRSSPRSIRSISRSS